MVWCKHLLNLNLMAMSTKTSNACTSLFFSFSRLHILLLEVDDNSIDNILDQLLPEEQTFFKFLDSQLELVNSFYQGNE